VPGTDDGCSVVSLVVEMRIFGIQR